MFAQFPPFSGWQCFHFEGRFTLRPQSTASDSPMNAGSSYCVETLPIGLGPSPVEDVGTEVPSNVPTKLDGCNHMVRSDALPPTGVLARAALLPLLWRLLAASTQQARDASSNAPPAVTR